ncbi:hypothetical protein HYV83_05515, partial [Candidatus Woesearchaeota archaeon]|nr:hypothetical protein [Candidatus Woesearchaeota archaeon]
KEDSKSRRFSVKEKFYIAEKDFGEIAKLKASSLVRLMDCLNFKKSNGSFSFDSLEYEKYRMGGSKIIHWLPSDDKQLVKVNVLMPDAKISKGVAEAASADIKEGDIVQFARFGFCRLEKKNAKELSFIYCHN